MVYGLTFATPDAADGFQQWLDYAINPPPAAAAPTRNAPVAALHAAVSPCSASEDSHYQRPPPRPAPSKQQPTNGPDIIDSHQQSVHIVPTFLPRCMKCRRGLTMRILSVRLSVDVCPSVRPSVKCVHCDKTQERYV